MSARNFPFKITDGLPKKSDDEDHDREKGGTVPIEINNNLTMKRFIKYLKIIDNAYKSLFFLKSFHELQVKLGMNEDANSNNRKELLESFLLGSALNQWMLMKEENGADPLDDVDQENFQKLCATSFWRLKRLQ